jgi:hypothetical protein
LPCIPQFVGTYLSTFTAYITRMRVLVGRDPGYYWEKDHKDELHDKNDFYPKSPFWMREWPMVLADIKR